MPPPPEIAAVTNETSAREESASCFPLHPCVQVCECGWGGRRGRRSLAQFGASSSSCSEGKTQKELDGSIRFDPTDGDEPRLLLANSLVSL